VSAPRAQPLDGRPLAAALAFTLLGGTAMGAANLLSAYALSRPMSLTHTQAHAHAQAFGFVGLFLVGFAHALLPRLVRRPLPFPRLARATFGLVAGGALLHLLGLPLAAWAPGRWLVLLSGPPLALGLLFLCLNAWGVLRGEPARGGFAPLVRLGALLLAAAGVLAAVLGARLALRGERLYPVEGVQVLWLLAVEGAAAAMALGVAARMLPALLGTRPVRGALLSWAHGALVLGVGGGALLALLGAAPGSPLALAARALGGAALVLGALAFPLGRLLAKAKDPFFPLAVRCAFLALLGSGLLTLGGAVAQALGGAAAWASPDVARHLLTVGFLSLLITAMAVKLVPGLRGGVLARAPLRWVALGGLAGAALLRAAVPLAWRGVPGAGGAVALSGVLAWGGLLALALLLRATWRSGKA
jgi:uncharacterized protein involved in response to NO